MLKKITTIIFLSIFIYSCSEEISNNKIDNVPPETSLFLFTDSLISQQQSRLTVNWWGDDPDGLVNKLRGYRRRLEIQDEVSIVRDIKSREPIISGSR